jgi:hypothetical protein
MVKKVINSQKVKSMTERRRNIACHINYRESNSYSSPGAVVSFYIDGDLQARCHGGGYDMTGTVIGDWMTRAFKDELKQLALGLFYNEKYIYLPFNRGLYGLSLHDKESQVYLDGACGTNTMEFILGLLGYRLERLTSTPSKTGFILRRLHEDDYEYETHQREAFFRIPIKTELEVIRVERKHREGEPPWQAAMRKNGEKRQSSTFLAGDVFNVPVSEQFAKLLSTTHITQDYWEMHYRSAWITPENLFYRFGSPRQDTYLIEVTLSGEKLTWREVIDELL